MVKDEGQPEESVIGALRRATASRHTALEERLRLDTSLDAQRYVAVLRGFEAFLREWEPHVRSALPAVLAARFDEFCRLHLVRDDLAVLGATHAQGDSLCIAPRLKLPDVFSALGSWYVLAGSALGGQVIARQVFPSLGVTSDAGGAYFTGWGRDTSRRWREFLGLLEQTVPNTDAARTRASQSAQATFDLLIDTFQQVLNEPVAA